VPDVELNFSTPLRLRCAFHHLLLLLLLLYFLSSTTIICMYCLWNGFATPLYAL
jgi:hypothetical protein